MPTNKDVDRHYNKQSWALSVGSRKYIFLLPTFILFLLHLSIGVKRVKRELKGKLKREVKREVKKGVKEGVKKDDSHAGVCGLSHIRPARCA